MISIYITNYNYEKYISQAIESVLNQSFQDFELFIIDDGSTDNSKNIIESYTHHPKINIIYQKNKGLNITNNIALRLSNGKYIMRLDADDHLTLDALEKMYIVLESNKNIGMVFPDYYLVDAENNIMSEIVRHDFKEDVDLLDQPAHGACTMIRTDFLKSVGGYDESYSCQDGYELWIKFVSKFNVTNIREYLFYYRQHGENLTTNENRILDTRRQINGDFVKNNNISLPKTIAIIPIRPTRLKGEILAFTKIGMKNILDVKIQKCLEAELLSKIVITSSVPEIQEYVLEKYKGNERILFIERPQALARFNKSLRGTIDYILDREELKNESIDAFMILPLEYIFLGGQVIDDAINTIEIFNADSLISVRSEHSSFYQHHGNGMVSIMEQANFTQLEREALYRGTGGIQLTRLNAFQTNRKVLSGKVGHIVVDQKTAIGIFSGFDLELVQLLLS